MEFRPLHHLSNFTGMQQYFETGMLKFLTELFHTNLVGHPMKLPLFYWVNRPQPLDIVASLFSPVMWLKM